jgi:hypothetical protein
MSAGENFLDRLPLPGLLNPIWTEGFPLLGGYTLPVPSPERFGGSGPESALKRGRLTQ